MMKAILLSFAVAILLAGTAIADAAEPVGTIEEIAGAAIATDAAGTQRDLAKGSPVYLGDKIVTGAGAHLMIRFSDNSTIGQGENAEFVINQYVYNPAEKEENQAAFRVLKGVFRFVTDQITKLNPEAYEVESNYGTIGIRGCELAFEIAGERDQVFIVSLAGPETILVQLNEEHRAGRDRASLLVREPGVAVGLSPLDGLTERRFDPGELNRLLQLVGAYLALDDGGDAESEPDEESVEDFAGPPPDDTPEPEEELPVEPDEIIENQQEQVAVAQVSQTVHETPVDEQGDDPPDLVTDDDQPVDGLDGAPEPAGDDADPPIPGPRPEPTDGGEKPLPTRPQPEGPPFRAAEASGSDWTWGIWARSYVEQDASGNEVRTFKYWLSTSTRNIDPAAYDAIAQGTAQYALSGRGPAGAFVTWGSQSLVLDGEGVFDVLVGGGQPGTWSGDFALGMQSPNQLTFSLDGSIGAGGTVQGNAPANYTLNAFGQTWGTPSSSQVEGNLVGPGAAANPISGILIRYNFGHGAGGPEVVGAAGADLH